MYNQQISLPDGTLVKYCHTPEPLYASEDGEHIFLLKSTGVLRELTQRRLQPAPRSVNYGRKQKYLKVVISVRGKTINYLVHLLVAAAWHGPHRYPDFECHHLNGVTTDNHASNLIWLTPPEHRCFDAALKHGLILHREDPNERMEYEMTHHCEV